MLEVVRLVVVVTIVFILGIIRGVHPDLLLLLLVWVDLRLRLVMMAVVVALLLLLRLLLVLLLDLPMQMINRRRACICQVRTRNVIVAQVLKRLHVLGLVTCIVTMMVQGIAELNLIQGLVVGGRGGERDHLFQWAGVWCGQLEYAVARMGATSKPRLTIHLVILHLMSLVLVLDVMVMVGVAISLVETVGSNWGLLHAHHVVADHPMLLCSNMRCLTRYWDLFVVRKLIVQLVRVNSLAPLDWVVVLLVHCVE